MPNPLTDERLNEIEKSIDLYRWTNALPFVATADELLAEVRRLRPEIERLREALQRIENGAYYDTMPIIEMYEIARAAIAEKGPTDGK